MIGRCVPAGVLPDARTFCTSEAYRSGFSSFYLSWNPRGFLPGYRGRRLCAGGASGGLFSTQNSRLSSQESATGNDPNQCQRNPTREKDTEAQLLSERPGFDTGQK